MNSESDYHLISEALQGSKDAFGKIIDKYKDAIFTLSVRMLKDIDEAKDVAQEIFIKAYKKLNKFEFKYELKNWLFAIAVNIIRDKLRKRKFAFVSLDKPVDTEENELQLEIPATDLVDHDKALIEKEEREKIFSVVNSLPEKYFTVITLRYVENLSYEEIAKILKKPLGTIKILIFRAKKLLKEKLENCLLT